MEPIRILHVVTYMGRGGLETMIMNYYRHMDRTKVQFDFLTHRDFRADYDDEIEALGGVIYRLPQLIPWSKSYHEALDGFFKSHPEYRIVHVHQDCLSSVILKAAQKRGVPVRIAHSHSSSQDKNLKYLIKLFYMRQIPRYATALFACGKAAGDWMFGGAPYQMVNNAINIEQYAYDPDKRANARRQLGVTQDAFVVGHVGRFQPVKNHVFLLRVFAQVKAQQSNAILLLVGDGELRSEMEKNAETLGISDSVIFTGTRSDVPELLQAMDVFVFPSLHEGLGIVAVEAQAAGLPCLASDGVPTECDITPLISHVALKESPELWTQRILALADTPRKDTREEIQNAGYDIAASARWLENYYLFQWKKDA